MIKAYLSLGSNMGEKKEYIDEALRKISHHPDIEVLQTSSYYETEPVGYLDQDTFINIVTEIKTTLGPHELLSYCNLIEEELHRKRVIRWGPRTIDIDILIFGEYQSQEEKLTIPHPRMTERAFVMVPLYEIARDITIKGTQIKDIISKLSKEGIKKVI